MGLLRTGSTKDDGLKIDIFGGEPGQNGLENENGKRVEWGKCA